MKSAFQHFINCLFLVWLVLMVSLVKQNRFMALGECYLQFYVSLQGSECLSNPQKRKGTGGRKLTIIFNSRICKDIELEIGNFIRIHQPW